MTSKFGKIQPRTVYKYHNSKGIFACDAKGLYVQ